MQIRLVKKRRRIWRAMFRIKTILKKLEVWLLQKRKFNSLSRFQKDLTLTELSCKIRARNEELIPITRRMDSKIKSSTLWQSGIWRTKILEMSSRKDSQALESKFKLNTLWISISSLTRQRALNHAKGLSRYKVKATCYLIGWLRKTAISNNRTCKK